MYSSIILTRINTPAQLRRLRARGVEFRGCGVNGLDNVLYFNGLYAQGYGDYGG